MRAGASLPAMASALAMATATAVGRTVIDMPAPRGHPVESVSAGDSKKADLGAVALYRYASARTVPLYSYLSVPLYRPYYGYGYGFGLGYGHGYGYGYPFGFGSGRYWGYGYGYHRHSIGFRRTGFRLGLRRWRR